MLQDASDETAMKPASEDDRFALYAADMMFLSGVLVGTIFLSAGNWTEAGVTLTAAVGGAAYSLYKGQPWPGWAILRYWRHYL